MDWRAALHECRFRKRLCDPDPSYPGVRDGSENRNVTPHSNNPSPPILIIQAENPYITSIQLSLNLYSTSIQPSLNLYSTFIQPSLNLYSTSIQPSLNLYSTFIQPLFNLHSTLT
uniref:Uncharacterized protein n=1 Tax=Oncorhynchus tshawytscha TaxID=74940 RepID=A0A8C8C0B7_ONCTS